VLPLVRKELPADKVRAFVALRMDEDLPGADAFLGRLFERLDCKERVTEEWCRGHDVPFISLTAAMRESARIGRQPYFTYNEHWTPIGHEVAAEEVHRRLAAGQSDGVTDVTAVVGDGGLGG